MNFKLARINKATPTVNREASDLSLTGSTASSLFCEISAKSDPAQDAHAEQIRSRIIQTETEWDSIRNDWNELFAASPQAAPPLDFEWMRNWWRVYGSFYGTGGLRIFTVWRNDRLIGVLPLYLNRIKEFPVAMLALRFISTGEAEIEEVCPDYLDMLCLPGDEDLCAGLAWKEIAGMDWDYLELLDMPTDTSLLKSDYVLYKTQPFLRGSCPIAELTGGFDAYLNRRSAHSRQKARRLLREGEDAGVKFDIVDHSQADSTMKDMIRLHQKRWNSEGKNGAFATERFIEFHRQLLSKWLPVGRASLAKLSYCGKLAAVLYGFTYKNRFYFYQSGIDRLEHGLLTSPGTLALLLLMRALSESGITEYDFLRGTSSYKERLTSKTNELSGIRIWRRTWRATICRLARLAKRLLNKCLRMSRSGKGL